MRTLSVRLSDDLIEELQAYAENDRRPVGQIMRMAVEQFLRNPREVPASLSHPKARRPTAPTDGAVTHPVETAQRTDEARRLQSRCDHPRLRRVGTACTVCFKDPV